MSSSNPETSGGSPESNLTPTDIHDFNRLEAIAQRGLESYKQVCSALAEIRDRHLYRDSHGSFESYVRERWGVSGANGASLARSTIQRDPGGPSPAKREPPTTLCKPCEELARACEQTLSALDADDRLAIDIRLAVRNQGAPGTPSDVQTLDTSEIAQPMGDELLPKLRWLLTRATGTIRDVAHQLETRAADIDDCGRAQLREDILVLDGELAVAKALLAELIDWDSELKRLLGDDLPPFDTDPDNDD